LKGECTASGSEGKGEVSPVKCIKRGESEKTPSNLRCTRTVGPNLREKKKTNKKEGFGKKTRSGKGRKVGTPEGSAREKILKREAARRLFGSREGEDKKTGAAKPRRFISNGNFGGKGMKRTKQKHA